MQSQAEPCGASGSHWQKQRFGQKPAKESAFPRCLGKAARPSPHRRKIEFFSHDGSPLEPNTDSYGIAAQWVAKTQPRLNPEFWGTYLAVGYLVVRRLSRSREHTCSYATPSHIQGARGNATRICLLRHRRALLFSSKVTISTVVVQTNTADTRTTAWECRHLAV